MNIIFFGTPYLCIPYLELLHREYNLIGVVCNPDQPVGRKQLLTAPPTKVWAERHGILVLQPEKLKGFTDTLQHYAADIYIVVAYGKIIPENIINLPHYGTLNVHYSLLPRWRGASPVEATILAGDTVGGVCVQQMRYELDSGPIITSQELPIEPNAYARELRDGIMTETGVMLLNKVLQTKLLHQQSDGIIDYTEQNHALATYCTRIKKSDGELLPNHTDETRWRKYRAYWPWPGVFYFDESGKRIKITDATFENGKFIIQKYIREGESEISI